MDDNYPFIPAGPKVSITIPSYNHAQFLPAAIESALAQTYRNLEIIIVDDGSTDESLQIAEAYAALHPNLVRVVTHPGHANRGISATVNRCFEETAGVYWMGLPSDDLLHPLKVAEQVAFLEQHPEIDWVYCYALHIDEHDRQRPELGLFGVDITRADDPVERMILGNAIPGMTVLMRRNAVAQIEPHDETLIYGDWDFWVRLAAHHRVAFLPHARVLYRVHSYNTSVGNKTEINLRRILQVLLKLRQQATKIGGALARPRTQALLDLQLAFYSYCVRDEAQAEQHLVAAFATDPTLQWDQRYFVHWLKHCYSTLLTMSPHQPINGFCDWTTDHLPAGLAEGFIRAVTHAVAGRAFRHLADMYYRALTHWQGRAKVFRSLLHDRRVWREPNLMTMHLEALASSWFRRWLSPLSKVYSAGR